MPGDQFGGNMLPNIKKIEVRKSIFFLEFETREELCATFLRFQEYYESPEFKGKVFTLEEYKDWYTKQKGIFSYYTDWGGFNIPSRILIPFKQGLFDPLSDAEKLFLSLFEGDQTPFYVIGTYSGVPKDKFEATLKHEIAHGLFSTNLEYQREVLAVINRYDTSKMRAWLETNAGYHADVHSDEVHAYALTPSEKAPLPDPEMKRELEEIFERYS